MIKSIFPKILLLSHLYLLSSCTSMQELSKDFGEMFNDASDYVVGIFNDSSREDTVQKYDYKGENFFMKIESASISANYSHPGDKISSEIRVALLAPDSEQEVSLSIDRVLLYGEETIQLGNKKPEMVAQGIVSLSSGLMLPKDVDKGKYVLKTTLSVGVVSESTNNEFVVY